MILDTGSAFTSFENKTCLENTQESGEFPNMTTNAGERTTKETGQLPGFESEVWSDEKSMTDIMSFANPSDQCVVTCDNRIEDAFAVTTGENEKIKFSWDKGSNSHAHKFPKTFVDASKKKNDKHAFAESAAENGANCSTEQCE